MHLLIDNSNTRTKFALDLNGELSAWRTILPTAEVSAANLRKALEGKNFEKITLCSVVPDAAALMRDFFEQPLHQISHYSKLPITIDLSLIHI